MSPPSLSLFRRSGLAHLRPFQSADRLELAACRFLQGTRYYDGGCGSGAAVTGCSVFEYCHANVIE